LQPFLAIQRGFYPSLIDPKVASNNFNYIPNSCHLGINEYGEQASALTMLLTGPNMGGKSTYMRQIASLVVLAQIVRLLEVYSIKCITAIKNTNCNIIFVIS
jgi:dsDNA-specific endonuclease/ATPase MutS2